ncbi:hypothetical protein VTJ04DRAFT_8025 [Mycothermus thermophilus]|uniref:uncharacterized protein n=1 Tax=Humicola insolens TaxID=85995 RepID=UPI003743E886
MGRRDLGLLDFVRSPDETTGSSLSPSCSQSPHPHNPPPSLPSLLLNPRQPKSTDLKFNLPFPTRAAALSHLFLLPCSASGTQRYHRDLASIHSPTLIL